MCGIAGIVALDGQSVMEQQLRAAAETLHHRGPDSQNIWLSNDRLTGLGHARLSIIGLDNGAQPLSSQDGTVHVVVNGEFYDHDTIRAACIKRGYQFKTDSDSEILIPLYQQYGMACLQQLRGEFAFILWDESRQALFICRDRFGIKPLVYAEDSGRFYVASEAKALLAMGVKPEWDPVTVEDAEYVVRAMSGTYFKGIKNLAAGHYLEVTQKKQRQHRYWDFNYPDMASFPGDHFEEECIDRFKFLLKEAVRLRLRADVPVGCYLSGGLDSAAILAMMAEQSNAPINAYTIAFNEDGDDTLYNEADHAREMAEFTGVTQHIIPIHENDLALNFVDALWHSECPMINGNGVAKFLLSKHVHAAGHRVVLTGEGADEVLGGYSFFREDLLNQQRETGHSQDIDRSLSQLHAGNRVTAGVFDGGDPGADLSSIQSRLGYLPTELKSFTHIAAILRGLRTEDFAASQIGLVPYANLMASLDIDQLNNRCYLDQSLYIHSKSVLPTFILTVLGDRAEMAHSIEGRVPFLDHKLVEYLVGVHPTLKIRGLTEKYLLREAVRGQVTERLYRREKHPFAAPPAANNICGGNPGPLKALMMDTFYGSDLRDLPFYDQRKVIKFFEQTEVPNTGATAAVRDVVLMTILSLCLMQKTFRLSL